jgi:hypothetical protein
MRTVSAPQQPRETGSLRGPEAQRIGRRFWLIAGTLVLVVFASIVVVSFVSAANDNARINRLKSHGISVEVTVTSCVGNIGGSGSNAAGYTCHGTYSVHGVRHNEVIASKSTSSRTGAKLLAVADPDRPSTVELASALARSSSASSAFVVPSLLLLFLIGLIWCALRRERATRPRQLPEP